MSQPIPAGGRPRITASIMPAFDRASVTVRPGTDVVARFPGAILVARVADDDEGDRSLRAVLDLFGGDAAANTPGERVAQGLLVLIEDGLAPADLALLAATEGGLTVVLAGAGRVSGHGARMAAEDGPVIRDLEWPPTPLLLDLGTGEDPPADNFRSQARVRHLDLRAGVVPGRAAVLAAAVTAPGKVQPGQETPLSPPPAAANAAEPAPPMRHDQILGMSPLGARRPPLAIPAAGVPPQQVPGEPVSAVPLVRGYHCRDGHINDPRALFCAICGIRMAESTSVLVEGPRPALGLLVFDNGASFALDYDYLLGREPDTDERVRAGQLRPLVLYDTTGTISRRHAEIRLDDWDVLLIDCGSANGTLVAERDAAVWSTLVPGQPIRMLASMQVRIGDRSFVFESLQGAP